MAVTAYVFFFVQLTIHLEFYYMSPFFLLANHMVISKIFCVIHSLHRVKKMKVRKGLSWTALSNSCLFQNYSILFPLILIFY